MIYDNFKYLYADPGETTTAFSNDHLTLTDIGRKADDRRTHFESRQQTVRLQKKSTIRGLRNKSDELMTLMTRLNAIPFQTVHKQIF